MSQTPVLPSLTHITQTILCQRSGIAMGEMTLFLHEGHLAYLQAHSQSIYLHPFYNLSPSVLNSKFDAGLEEAKDSGYTRNNAAQQRLQLLFSAIAFSLDCIKQDDPGLPSWPVTIGSGKRLLSLSKWHYFETSHRLKLPELHLARSNTNDAWQNVRFWLDACYAVKEDWEAKGRKINQDALLNTRTNALRELKSESYRKIDLNKIWRWIEVQFEGEVPPGRIETWSDLFFHGDIEPENWSYRNGVAEDVDDLQEALLEHCDIGNPIMHFIQSRLNAIRSIIRDFYSSFTVVRNLVDRNMLNDDGSVKKEHTGEIEMQTQQELALYESYEKKLAELGGLPPKPQRASFATIGTFMKAEAQWNIMARLAKTQAQRDATKVQP